MNYYKIRIKDIEGETATFYSWADTALEALNNVADDIQEMHLEPALITTSLVTSLVLRNGGWDWGVKA